MLCGFYAGAGDQLLWAALGATALVITCCTVFSETDQFLLPRHMARHGISLLHYVSCPSAAVATPNWHVISGLFGSDTQNSGFCFFVWFGLAELIFELGIQSWCVKYHLWSCSSDFLEEGAVLMALCVPDHGCFGCSVHLQISFSWKPLGAGAQGTHPVRWFIKSSLCKMAQI